MNSAKIRMCLSLGLCVVGLAVLLFVAPFSKAEDESVFSRAVAAPYYAVAQRDARALCSDFTYRISAMLGGPRNPGMNCVTRVGRVLAEQSVFEPKEWTDAAETINVNEVSSDGDREVVGIRYGNQRNVVLRAVLEKIYGRWRIATAPIFAIIKGCTRGMGMARCGPKARWLWFVVGMPAAGHPIYGSSRYR